MEQSSRPITGQEDRPETTESYVVGVEISPSIGTEQFDPNQATITINKKQKDHVSPIPQTNEEQQGDDNEEDESPENRRGSVGSSISLGEFENAAKSMEEKEAEIIRQCQLTNTLFEDDEFPAGPPSLYNDPDNIPDYDQGMGCEAWCRPQEYTDKPIMFLDGITPRDVQQGVLGDCWFLGAMCAVATKPEIIEKLFVNVEQFRSCGMVTCQFFIDGEWKQVVVDTRLPYSSRVGGPIYAHCQDNNECWLPILEKAYAKIHRTYENLHGGKMTEAFVDLTGESCEKYNLEDPNTSPMIHNGELWNLLLKSHRQGSVMGCSMTSKDNDGEMHEEYSQNGIWKNHAYGIMDVREINLNGKQLKLIRIRNPWGDHREWKGPFSDENEEWDQNRGLLDILNYQFGPDGTWWMCFQHWAEEYNRLYVCRMFPERWSKYIIDSKWKGVTAGGPPPMTIDSDQQTNKTVRMDSDDKWFNNPQFRITISKKTQIFFSLMQQDAKSSGKQYLPCNFILVKTKDRRNRIWDLDRDDIILNAAEGLQRFGQREITREVILEPPEGKTIAHYIIIPNLELDGKRLEQLRNAKKGGRQFWLRIFSSNPVEIVELKKTYECIMRGEWNETTSGGGRFSERGFDNPLWCRNPQYFLNINQPTLMKIILKRVGAIKNKKGKNCCIGMVICKAPQKQMGRKGKLARKNKDDDQYFTAEDLERKLQILWNEWFEESYYMNEELSCMFEKLDPHHGPFLIVPSMVSNGPLAKYSLTIFSNFPVTLQRLEDACHVAFPGQWKNGNDGGSHLYDKPFVQNLEKQSWGTNPKYQLVFRNPGEHVRAYITLSRPQGLWSVKMAKNTVGCMMGLYIFEGGITRPERGAWIKEPRFVPTGDVDEVLDEIPRPEGYIIMPSTYENNIRGPFVLSVSSQHEFTLTKMDEE